MALPDVAKAASSLPTLPRWQALLKARHILQPALALNWRPDGHAWRFPLFTDGGKAYVTPDEKTAFRLKAFDSGAHPRFWFDPKKPDKWTDLIPYHPPWYIVPGGKEAITDRGEVYVACGESDMLSILAAGQKNVVSFFGEGNVPHDLVDRLKAMGCTSVQYFPDNDDPGQKACQKLAGALFNSGIEFHAWKLPELMNQAKIKDINDVWVARGGDLESFWDALAGLTAVPADWVACSQPTLPPGKAEPSQNDRDLPEEYYQAVELALGVDISQVDEAGFTKKPVKCPMASHEHDPERPAAHWHAQKKFLICFKCAGKTWNAVETGQVLGLDWRAFIPKPPVVAPAKALDTRPAKPPAGVMLDQALGGLTNVYQGKNEKIVRAPLLLPFKNLHKFDGMARQGVPPGKMLLILGDTGSGKTAMCETIMDSWLAQGWWGVVWGPEWTPEEYAQRMIQRAGGPSLNRLMENQTWLYEAARDVPEVKRQGKAFTEDEKQGALAIIDRLNKLTGGLGYLTKMGQSIEDVNKEMGRLMDENPGHPWAFACWDYAQMMGARGANETERAKEAIARCKAFCVDRKMAGIIVSQVTKEDGTKAATKGKVLDLNSAQFIRGDNCNLAVSLTRPVDDQGEASNTAIAAVVKNSLGKRGWDNLYLHPERLRWYDTAQEAEPWAF